MRRCLVGNRGSRLTSEGGEKGVQQQEMLKAGHAHWKVLEEDENREEGTERNSQRHLSPRRWVSSRVFSRASLRDLGTDCGRKRPSLYLHTCPSHAPVQSR